MRIRIFILLFIILAACNPGGQRVSGFVSQTNRRGVGSGLPEAWWVQIDGTFYSVDETTYENTLPGDTITLICDSSGMCREGGQ